MKDAVEDRTKLSPIDKDTCIRVCYSAGYHIDLPIYIVKDDVAYLATKKAVSYTHLDVYKRQL